VTRRTGQYVAIWATLAASMAIACATDPMGADIPPAASQPTSMASEGEVGAPEPRPIEKRLVGRKEAPSKTDDGLTRTLLSLGAVVLAILGVRYLLRRMGIGQPGRSVAHGMELASSLRIGPRHQLLLVRMGRRLVLVGSGPEGMSRLAEVTDPGEIDELLGRASDKAAAPSQAPQSLSPKGEWS